MMFKQFRPLSGDKSASLPDPALGRTAYELTENIPVGTYTMVQPADGGLAYFAFMSSRFLEITGLNREEAASDPIKGFMCVHPDDFDDWVKLNVKTFEEKVPFYGETRLLVEGEIRWVSAESIPRGLPDGSTVWEGVLIDITEKKLFEEQLRVSLEESDSLRRKAEEASKAKSEFLTNISHETKTPLSGVLGFTELLKDTPLTPTQREYVENIQVSGKALLDIIDNLLEVSSMESGHLTLEPVRTNLFDLVGEVADTLKYSAHEKFLEFLVDIDATVPRFIQIDPVRLRQVLQNLLCNAIKFTPKGSVELRLTCASKGAGTGRLTVAVRDTGIGISEKQRSTLFKPFIQGDPSRSRSYSGIGAGLAIADYIVRKMGGNIEVQSSPGEGSTFYFSIPVEIETDYQMAPPKLEEIGRCLIVDDHAGSRDHLARMLSGWGIECVPSDGTFTSMMKLVSEESIDLIICNYKLPSMFGEDMVRAVREAIGVGHLQIPAILMYNSVDAKTLHNASMSAPIHTAIPKPIRREHLHSILKSIAGDKLLLQEVTARPPSSTPATRKLVISQSSALRVLIADDILLNKMYIRGLERVYLRKRVPIVALTAMADSTEMDRCLKSGMDGFVTKPLDARKLHTELVQFFR